MQLQLQYKVDLYERESLIIFDEVQLCPRARQAIKSLVKDHRYDYIETGSLISIKKNVQDILIPSEERKLNMYPMDYEEFLWALNDETTIPLIHKLFDSQKPFGEEINRKLMRDFRLYMLVGGMPQAVDEYIKTNNFRKVDDVKRDIKSHIDAAHGHAGGFFHEIYAQDIHAAGRAAVVEHQADACAGNDAAQNRGSQHVVENRFGGRGQQAEKGGVADGTQQRFDAEMP